MTRPQTASNSFAPPQTLGIVALAGGGGIGELPRSALQGPISVRSGVEQSHIKVLMMTQL